MLFSVKFLLCGGVMIVFSQLLWVDSSFKIFGNSSRVDFLKCKTI